MDFLEACKKIIAIDSTPSNGTGEVCAFINTLAQELGFKVRLEEEVQRGIDEANILCFTEEVKNSVHFMLQTHLDTVDPGSFAFWEKTGRNPFHATIHNSSIYGLGVADTKLDFLCKLYAARKFIGQKPRKAFAVVGTYGEEYNMNGAIRLIRHKTLAADRILVSEPTNFNLVYSGKGLANIEITIPFSEEEMQARMDHDSGEGQSTQCKMFKGKATHSSQPQLGTNAVEKTFDFLKNLPDQLLVLEIDGGTNYNTIPVQALLEFDLIHLSCQTVNQKILKIYEKIQSLKTKFEAILDNNFNPPMTTLNIGMIRTYSDHIKLMGCVRWPPALAEKTYLEWIEDLKVFCGQMGAVFRVRDHKKPFAIDKNSEFVQQCLKVIRTLEPNCQLATQPVTNEANVFNKLGIETLVFGPGRREGNSQTSQESISIDKLTAAIKVYENLIQEICF